MALFGIRAVLAAAMLAAAGCASSHSLSGSLNDIGADASLKGILFADRSHDYSDVDMTLYEGRLMLTGTMRSETGRKKLVENAWKADGVKQVIDEIFVGDRTPIGRGFEDSRIDQTIRAKFLTSSEVKFSHFKMSVSGGVVYLIGVADDQKELDAALTRARTVSGVASVVSHVILAAPAPAL
jgi:osmotically-inducible protein OsmY